MRSNSLVNPVLSLPMLRSSLNEDALSMLIDLKISAQEVKSTSSRTHTNFWWHLVFTTAFALPAWTLFSCFCTRLLMAYQWYTWSLSQRFMDCFGVAKHCLLVHKRNGKMLDDQCFKRPSTILYTFKISPFGDTTDTQHWCWVLINLNGWKDVHWSTSDKSSLADAQEIELWNTCCVSLWRYYAAVVDSKLLHQWWVHPLAKIYAHCSEKSKLENR